MPRRWQNAIDYGSAFVFYLTFPRATHLWRWPLRLGPRGLTAYVVVKTTVGMGVRGWLVHYLKRKGEERERGREQVRRRLGREPTHDQLMEHLGLPAEAR